MTVQMIANTRVVSVKGVPPAKVMSLWNGGTGIAQFAGAAPLMTVQLNLIKGAVPAKVVPPRRVSAGDITLAGENPLSGGLFYLINPLVRG